ncbi:hypothetical protein SAMN04488589_2841 [Methanolobus vulcani]|jgi:hypothetical protein|uniref:Uncharacterized protein n=1 Tax=Methanolobus vulcani TaxID=38026 RepID=A0A7Z7AZ84_9EURY|nr:hypothetical protein [Methanolobus vulcani]SDG37314.1 hypothetical protein SAMN04488589_2841 [Methanolobus vulcani]
MISGKRQGALLTIFVILLTFIVIPAAAVAPPIILEGNLQIDGQPAAVGTEVTLVVDGNVVGGTTVTTEGLIGDERSNRLGLSSDYDVVMIYVNGVEAQTLDLKNYQEEVVSLDISAASSVQETPVEYEKSTSGGGGGFGTSTENAEVEASSVSESASSETEETILESTTEEPAAEVADEQVSEPGTSSSSSSGTIAIVVLALVGIVIVSYGYRSRK